MGKTKYDELKEEMRSKVDKAGGNRYSKSDLTHMTHVLLNTPEQEVTTYMKDVKDPVITKPVERYRESLKPVMKQMGIDGPELDKVQKVTFDKAHAEAVNDLAMTIVKDYTGTGRKMILPVTSKDESQMEITQVVKPEKIEDTKKLVQKEDGTYEQVPTGKRKKTSEHREMKVSNKVPGWLIDETEI